MNHSMAKINGRMLGMNERIDNRINQITEIFSKIKQLDDNELSHLYELVNLHKQALFIVSDLFAEAKYERDEAYRERKLLESEIKRDTEGTGVIKEATAEIAVQEYRKAENEADRIYSKYRYYFDAIEHGLVDHRQKRYKLDKELELINE